MLLLSPQIYREREDCWWVKYWYNGSFMHVQFRSLEMSVRMVRYYRFLIEMEAASCGGKITITGKMKQR